MLEERYPDYPAGTELRIKTSPVDDCAELMRQELLKRFGNTALVVTETYVPNHNGHPVNGRAARLTLDGEQVMGRDAPLGVSTYLLEPVS